MEQTDSPNPIVRERWWEYRSQMEHPPEIERSSIYRLPFVRVSCQSEPVESSSTEPNFKRTKAVGPSTLPHHPPPHHSHRLPGRGRRAGSAPHGKDAPSPLGRTEPRTRPTGTPPPSLCRCQRDRAPTPLRLINVRKDPKITQSSHQPIPPCPLTTSFGAAYILFLNRNSTTTRCHPHPRTPSRGGPRF